MCVSLSCRLTCLLVGIGEGGMKVTRLIKESVVIYPKHRCLWCITQYIMVDMLIDRLRAVRDVFRSVETWICFDDDNVYRTKSTWDQQNSIQLTQKNVCDFQGGVFRVYYIYKLYCWFWKPTLSVITKKIIKFKTRRMKIDYNIERAVDKTDFSCE